MGKLVEKERTGRWFFRIRDCYVARTEIKQVRLSGKTFVGSDGISRRWIVTLSETVRPDPKFRNVWISDEEAEPLIAMLEAECGKLDKITRADLVAEPAPF